MAEHQHTWIPSGGIFVSPLTIKGSQEQLGFWFKCLNLGEMNLAQESCSTFRTSEVSEQCFLPSEKGINKQEAALQSFASLVEFFKKC